MLRRLPACVVLILIAGLIPLNVVAQQAINASLSELDASHFPEIKVYLDLHNSLGMFHHNLQQQQIQLMEDGKPVTITRLQKLQPGAQFVVAINPGPAFGKQNLKGVSRFDMLQEWLAGWARSRRGSSTDDLSLVITTGPAISHTNDPRKWVEKLTGDEIEVRTAVPLNDTLARAIALAADPTPRPAMGRVILYITAAPENQDITILESLFDQAQAQGITIMVWMVASSEASSTIASGRLSELSQQAGGEFFTFTGEESLPNLENYLESFRFVYALEYSSSTTSSGTHLLQGKIVLETQQIDIQAISYELEILPPVPAFVSPPTELIRQLGNDTMATGKIPLENFSLPEQSIQVVFDFPDGHKRPIVQSALMVDGTIVEQKTSPPFDRFSWQIGQYRSSQVHHLQVKVVDSLGMTGSSIEIPVYVGIVLPPANPWAGFMSNLPLISGLAGLLAAAVLVLVLLMTGKIRPRLPGRAPFRRQESDPITQPVAHRQEPPTRRQHGAAGGLRWPGQTPVSLHTPATLSRISDGDNLSPSTPIPLNDEVITIGSDANRAMLVLEDPSIEAVHATLRREKSGDYRLCDAGSLAGTWVNFMPVSQGGALVEHGDTIHLGRIGFRFNLRQPRHVRKPIVRPLEQSEQALEEQRP